MVIQSYHNIYFIGIGGIGMSAIARYLHSLGKKVSGYDKTETALTRTLAEEGIAISYTDNLSGIPENIDLIIFTPAIPGDSIILNHFLQSGLPTIKRAEALGWISKSTQTIAVAGTHGKTSTSSMIAQLLLEGGVSFSAFLGGISYGLNSNYIGKGKDWIVVEADEYDRSFLHLEPEIAVLISMDPDHLDIYGDLEVMHDGFWKFINKIRPGGSLLFRQGLEKNFPPDWKASLQSAKIKWNSFGVNKGEIRAENVAVENGRFVFDYANDKGVEIKRIVSALPGRHNIENAVAAISVGLQIGVEERKMAETIGNFKGIFRRFERLYEDENVVYIDDYAHHPTELKAAISAVKELYPSQYILGIFQPHLYSRTRDFADGFSEVLGILDEVILMDIYPAREKPIEGVNSQMILNMIKKDKKHLLSEEQDIIEKVEKIRNGVILTLGAGDIDLLRDPIVKMMRKNA